MSDPMFDPDTDDETPLMEELLEAVNEFLDLYLGSDLDD